MKLNLYLLMGAVGGPPEFLARISWNGKNDETDTQQLQKISQKSKD